MNVRLAADCVKAPRFAATRATPEFAVAGVAFLALLWWQEPARSPRVVPVVDAALGATLAGLAVTDLRYRIIPNRVVYTALAAAAVLPFASGGSGAENVVFGASLTLAVVLPVYALSRGGLGGGDVKMAALVGAIVGFPAIVNALLFATIAAGMAAMGLVATGQAHRGASLPYGPFLALGALLALG